MGCAGSKVQHSANTGVQAHGMNPAGSRLNGDTAFELQSRGIRPGRRRKLVHVVVPSTEQSSARSTAVADFSSEGTTINSTVLSKGRISRGAPPRTPGPFSNTTNTSTSIIHRRTRLTAQTSSGTQQSGSLPNTTPVDFLLTDEFALLTFTVCTVFAAGIKMAVMPRLCFMNRVGQGASFDVRLAESPERCNAVKVIRKVGQERQQEQLRSIILELRALTHPPIKEHRNIIKLTAVGWTTDESDPNLRLPYLVMEYADQGTLNDLHKTLPFLAYGIRKRLCLDIAEGLKIIHKCGVVHGDVKAENILVFTDRQHGYVAKLGDFGCSIFEDERQRQSRIGGTYPWTAPEVKNSVPRELWRYTDIYSYGLLVWRSMLDDGRSPFDTLNLQGTIQARQERIQQLKESNELFPLAVNTLATVDNSDIRDSISTLRTVLQATLQPVPTERNIETAIDAFKGIPTLREATAPDSTRDLTLQLKWSSTYNPVSCASLEN
jgi:tRNA A-37 threonylcarbamoyl transferase component Bud32